MNGSGPNRIVVGITGASGAAYARRLVQLLVGADIETHLVVSPMGQRLLHDELGMEGVALENLVGVELGSGGIERLRLHKYRDVGAPLASGSFPHDGMIVIPCSSNTLSAVAHGSADNLLHRAAHVTLKERRRLVLVHRELPLSLIDIKNMHAVTEAGGIIVPASPGFYMMPRTIDDIVDFLVGRCLDLMGVKHDLDVRWSEKKSEW